MRHSDGLRASLANVVAPADPTDADFKQTVLLLHGDGTNGAQNNTFVDSSSNNFTITRNGNTTQGTFTPFSAEAGKWSNFFDGTGDWLSISDNTAFDFGNGNFTIECWVYQTSGTGAQYVVSQNTATLSTSQFDININAGSVSGTVYYGSSFVATSATSLPLNTWTHLALVRNGSTLTLYKDGVSSGTGSIGTNTLNNPTGEIRVGAINNATTPYPFIGYISNLRIVKGTAVYTNNFTPPTAPLTAITNTSLLTCQDNRFVDNSSNNFAITRNGDVRVTPFGPFAPSAAYSASVNGGSGYFDGNGDTLQITSGTRPFVSSSQDFTVECWVYLTNLSGLNMICHWNTAIEDYWYISSTRIELNLNNTYTVAENFNFSTNTWYHLAVSRQSNVNKIFVNGTQIGNNVTNSNNWGRSDVTFTIGNWIASPNYFFNGYISNFRLVAGTAVYTSNFTPPTAPLTAITNTSLLLNFTNAGIIDNTGKNVLETVGNAQIDTTIKKYGTGAMEFDGSGDLVSVPATPDTIFGTGPFTIEFWVYIDTLVESGLVSKGTSAQSTNWQIVFADSGGYKFRFFHNSTVAFITGTTTLSTGTWYHVAVVGETSTIKLYVNGTQEASVTYSYNYTENSVLRCGINRGTTTYLDGFLDDVRITKGKARYTSNFTPPTAAFADK